MSAPSRHVALLGTERELLPQSRRIGPTDPNEQIRVSLRLRPKRPVDQASLDQMNSRLPADRPYLTREEYAANFGADPADVQAVTSAMVAHNLQVTRTDEAGRIVEVRGTVGDMSTLFKVALEDYDHPQGRYRARIGQIHVPAELAGIVEAVLGLDTRRLARSHVRRSHAPGHSFTPPQVAELYSFPAGTTGAGQSVAILEFGGGYDEAELATYFSQIGVPMPQIASVSIDGTPNDPNGNPDEVGEVMLDIEVVGSIAPGANIIVYFAPFTEKGWVDALSAVMNDTVNRPSVVSISWGFAERHGIGGFTWTQAAMQAVDETLQAAALMGVTVTAAAGDDGSTDQIRDGRSHVDFPSSSPHALACGGTRLEAAHGAIAREIVWNELPANGATGGGISDAFDLPSYQSGVKVPPSANPGGRVGRGVPDVCGNADPTTGYLVLSGGRLQPIGGTSAVAPLWAALVARMNERLSKPAGFINTVLYNLSGAAGGYHDVTAGSNGAYPASAGWDACTGLGSPNGANLLAALSGASGPAHAVVEEQSPVAAIPRAA